jgi:hypothetical protein
MRKLIACSAVVLLSIAGSAVPALAQKPPPDPDRTKRSTFERDCERRGGTYIDLDGLTRVCLLPD